jgi:site-specific DNA-methyltransferase (adenine-specific)
MTETPKCKIKLYRFGNNGYVSESQIINNRQLIGRYKVLVSKASPGGDEYPHMIVSQPIISEPNSVCTETYLVIKDFDTRQQAENLVSYIKTRFFRFMMSLIKNTQNISKASYAFVPIQDFSESWTDEKLYKKYGLTEEEIAFIESLIRPME